ncbi:VOC family protein [Sulfitobacter sp. 1151]|uniref:VOC family protein n=1 Tax=Parasulfitobacter algicola TaxID=2614809 RepID=A0ABX2IT87_9RHOB|nr:VOC family protein [Sulfitobacter algicola]
MLKLDHITVIAPTLIQGVRHVQECLGLKVPFGTHHDYMATYNHRLQLGNDVYLEIVALDPACTSPDRARWFGLDNLETVRSDWDEGRRLRGWVASTENIDALISKHGTIFGDKVCLPINTPTFAFSIPKNGALPLDGAAPSIIDHQGDPTSMAEIPDMGARLRSLTLEHPDPIAIETLYRELSINHPPLIIDGPKVRYCAQIETPDGLKKLT